jgi:multidrug efflux pump subunit AcrA (membrane-fusion protein)
MKKKYYVGIIVVFVIIIAILIFKPGKSDALKQLTVKVEKGKFEILVTTTGELQAKSSVDIMGPSELRNSRSLRIREIKIKDLVPEGTVVDSGDYVGELDPSELATSLKDLDDEVETSESQYLKTQLDTTMQLRELRDQLINLKFAVEEKQIVLDQSKFEPPATIRQATIEMEKAKRAYTQYKDNYSLKVQQAEASMKEASIELDQDKRKVEQINKVIKKFTIYAPQSGMVIYKKEWSGEKRKVGSTISPWDMAVATLPDLSVMHSKTYVNEIDISKIKVGQEVRIGIDAFPDKKYTGQIIEVANIGEQLQNTDAKVFEILIYVDQSDEIMRPAMTTSNQVITNAYNDVLFLPLEAIHNEDSISFVYTKSNKKQVIVPGETNENYIIIEQGLEESDVVYLSIPENLDRFKLAGEELISVLKEREIKKQMEDEKSRKEHERPERNFGKQGGRKRGPASGSKSN